MPLTKALTRRNIIAAFALTAVAIVPGYFLLRRPPRVAMERYVPASALGFIEVENLADLADGLTSTRAWQELAPALGLSSQLRQIGLAADLIGRTGLGPDEAVVAARAQYAIAFTDLEASSGVTEEGPFVHLKPRLVLIAETHGSPGAAARLLNDRAALIAKRIYGESAVEDSQDYQGTRLMIFHPPDAERELVACSSGSIVLIGNSSAAVVSCLDAISGRTETLLDNETLKEMRSAVDHDASVFGFATENGIEKLALVGPAIIAARSPDDPDQAKLFTDLFRNASKAALDSFLYSAEFSGDGVLERYLTVVRGRIGEAFTPAFKPTGQTSFDSLKLIPSTASGVTLLTIERPGDLPERAFKQLSPNFDVVAGVALREFVISFRKEYGLEGNDSVGDAIGDEVALATFGDGESSAMLLRVKDRSQLAARLTRYLEVKGGSFTRDQHNGVEVLVAGGDESRAAAFVEDYLVLATLEQIRAIIDAAARNESIAADDRLKKALASRPQSASVFSYKSEIDDAGDLMLGISKLTRVTDGSRSVLGQERVRSALWRVPRSSSFIEFRSYGIYSETRSAVGKFGLLSSLMLSDDQEGD